MFDLMILAPIGAVAALAYAFILSRRVMAQSEGTDLMKKIAASIRSGANCLPEETVQGCICLLRNHGRGSGCPGLCRSVNVFVPVAL